MEYPKTSYINGKTIVIGNTSLKDNEQVDIISSNGTEIKINGVVPGSGSGALPIDDSGDIKLNPGNLICLGDGNLTGKINAENITIKTANITEGNLEVVAGKVEVLNNNVEVSGNGSLIVKGNGEIKTEGSGNITAGSVGDIQTTLGDLISGNDIYFDGDDIYRRTNNPISQQSYKDYKQLPGKNDDNVFTGKNKFNSNTTEFAAKVSVGTRDPVSELFTQNLALNSSGNIECKTINNGTQIQCGNINCGNAGLNEVRARVFNTRTNENNLPDGWLIEQGLPNSPAQLIDKVLQIKAQEVGGFVTITPTDFVGQNPAIILDPNNTANGGKIYAASFTFGSTDDRFDLIQDLTGPLNNTLQINARTADGKVEFRDNSNNVILSVKKTDIFLAPTIPIKFGNYSFRPQQYSLNKTITIAANADTATFTNMIFNCRTDTFTNVNAGGSVPFYNAALEGFYKVTITQTALSSLGNFSNCDIMFEYVYRLSTQQTPDIIITEPIYNYRIKPTNQARPTIEINHLNTPVQSQPVFLLYSGQNSGETMPIEVRLTKLNF